MPRVKTCLLLVTLLAPLSCTSSSLGGRDISSGTNMVLLLPARRMQEIRIRLPQNYDEQRSYPLLLMLHGNGGQAASFQSLLKPYANQPVIQAFAEGLYPRVISSALGFSWFYETLNQNAGEIAGILSAENIIDGLKALTQRYRISRAYLFGFSQGASLAYLAGLRNASHVRGIAAVGGFLPAVDGPGSLLSAQNIEEAKTVKVFMARGRLDNYFKKSAFDRYKEFFLTRGYEVTALEYTGGHVLTPSLLDRIFAWIQSDGQEK